jgi:hypothetical protein
MVKVKFVDHFTAVSISHNALRLINTPNNNLYKRIVALKYLVYMKKKSIKRSKSIHVLCLTISNKNYKMIKKIKKMLNSALSTLN